MKVLISCLLLAFLYTANAAFVSPLHSRRSYAVKDSHNVPKQWSRLGSAPTGHWINLKIGLKQSRFDELEKHLYEVSTPSHPRYGQHLTSAEVNELVKPCDDALKQVHNWLHDHGIDTANLSYSPAKDWIKVDLPVRAIESLLDTKYSVYKHEDGTQLVRAPSWSLPTHLHKHIDTIQPTNSFFRPLARRSNLKTIKPIAEFGEQALKSVAYVKPEKDQTVTQACNGGAITPTCLRTLYGTASYTPQAAGRNQVGLTNYLGETSNRSDIYTFLQQYRPDAVDAAYTFSIEQINGGDNQQTPVDGLQYLSGVNLEGNLDAETLIGLTYPTPLFAYNTGGQPPFTPDAFESENTNEPYLDWLHYILAQDSIPQVISSSYGDDETSVPKSYALSVCNQFAQLGARGITFLCASGDSGVGSTGSCISNDGKNTSAFIPAFPASCPYVTSVGGTKNVEPEVAALNPDNNYSSGGGFSNYFPRPGYQDAVVPAYITSLGAQYSGQYNPAGRGYPDISAQGQHFATIWFGDIQILDGTSAACPTAAGVLALVNDVLIASGRPPLGFLNPCLYERLHAAFTDVTSGSAVGCGGDGFPAKEGWDPVTGFGTPYFPNVSTAALGVGGIGTGTGNGTRAYRW